MQIYVLPWLQVPEPIEVMGYTLRPCDNAIRQSGESAEHVSAATSYFFESSRRESLVEGQPTELVPVEPAVALLSDDASLPRVSNAMDGLFFAMMVANAPARYANAANFLQFHQSVSIGVPAGLARRTRTLFGSVLLGTRAEYAIETRPAWCGSYHAPDGDTLRLFEAVADRADAEPILECIRALHEAMSDADTVDRDMEHAAYARALERLLHRTNQKRHERAERQAKLAGDLLRLALTDEHMLSEPPLFVRRDFPLASLALVGAIKWIRDSRNSVWHSDNVQPDNPLQNQLVVRPNLVAFRVVSALTIASMSQLAPTLLTGRLKAYIAACEHWVGEIDTLTQTDAKSALNRFGELQSSYFIRMTLRPHDGASAP
jgi:hypothetical protein